MCGQVERNVHPSRSHAGTSGAEESRGKSSVQRLKVVGRNRFGISDLLAQGVDQFRRQHVTAGFAGD